MVVQVHYRPNLNGLQLLSGKTETKFLGEDQWQAKKHRSEHHRQ